MERVCVMKRSSVFIALPLCLDLFTQFQCSEFLFDRAPKSTVFPEIDFTIRCTLRLFLET